MTEDSQVQDDCVAIRQPHEFRSGDREKAMKELRIQRHDVTVECRGKYLSFVRNREWIRIQDQDMSLVTGAIRRMFSTDRGIYMIVENHRREDDCCSTVFDHRFMLILNTVEKETCKNVLLFTELTQDEALSLLTEDCQIAEI